MTLQYDPGNGGDGWVSPKTWKVPAPPDRPWRTTDVNSLAARTLKTRWEASESPSAEEGTFVGRTTAQAREDRLGRLWGAVPTLGPSESQHPRAKTDASETPRNPPTRTLTFREEALALRSEDKLMSLQCFKER